MMETTYPKMNILEKSECFRAFLLLVGMDHVISAGEKQLLMRIGKRLDFEGGFCEAAIADLLENKHITREPPVFSRSEFAESCLLDCMTIAVVDRDIHPWERDWIIRIAESNGLTPGWVDRRLATIARKGRQEREAADRLAIEDWL